MGGGDVAAGQWVVTPAKLTVSLRVLRRRPDGYHDLEAEMVSLDLADRLWIDPSGDGLEIVADANARAAGLDAGPDNLVRRALLAVGRRAGVELHKRIPVQGGLGGGSTDAAAVLRWAGCTDLTVAAGLGADVPFCVAGGRAVVTGLGDEVSARPFEPRTFVLLLPPFGVSTVDAYRAWDQQRARDQQASDQQDSDRQASDAGQRPAGSGRPAPESTTSRAGPVRRTPAGSVAGPVGHADRARAGAGRERLDVVRRSRSRGRGRRGPTGRHRRRAGEADRRPRRFGVVGRRGRRERLNATS